MSIDNIDISVQDRILDFTVLKYNSIHSIKYSPKVEFYRTLLDEPTGRTHDLVYHYPQMYCDTYKNNT